MDRHDPLVPILVVLCGRDRGSSSVLFFQGITEILLRTPTFAPQPYLVQAGLTSITVALFTEIGMVFKAVLFETDVPEHLFDFKLVPPVVDGLAKDVPVFLARREGDSCRLSRYDRETGHWQMHCLVCDASEFGQRLGELLKAEE